MDKEKKNCWRITSSKKGFPCMSFFHQDFGAPPGHAQAAVRDSAHLSPDTPLKSQQQLPIRLCPQPLAWGHPLLCQLEQGHWGKHAAGSRPLPVNLCPNLPGGEQLSRGRVYTERGSAGV